MRRRASATASYSSRFRAVQFLPNARLRRAVSFDPNLGRRAEDLQSSSTNKTIMRMRRNAHGLRSEPHGQRVPFRVDYEDDDPQYNPDIPLVDDDPRYNPDVPSPAIQDNEDMEPELSSSVSYALSRASRAVSFDLSRCSDHGLSNSPNRGVHGELGSDPHASHAPSEIQAPLLSPAVNSSSFSPVYSSPAAAILANAIASPAVEAALESAKAEAEAAQKKAVASALEAARAEAAVAQAQAVAEAVEVAKVEADLEQARAVAAALEAAKADADMAKVQAVASARTEAEFKDAWDVLPEEETVAATPVVGAASSLEHLQLVDKDEEEDDAENETREEVALDESEAVLVAQTEEPVQGAVPGAAAAMTIAAVGEIAVEGDEDTDTGRTTVESLLQLVARDAQSKSTVLEPSPSSSAASLKRGCVCFFPWDDQPWLQL